MSELPAGATVLLDRRQIAVGVASLGRQIRAAYGQRELTLLAVLHGALVFAADLLRELDMPLRVETVSARSYRGAATAPGELDLLLSHGESLRGRDVLVVDDILDTGRTLARLLPEVRAQEPASLAVCTLLDKPARRSEPVQADFVGFRIPDVFVVGYGLDWDGKFRNLPEIVALPNGAAPGGGA